MVRFWLLLIAQEVRTAQAACLSTSWHRNYQSSLISLQNHICFVHDNVALICITVIPILCLFKAFDHDFKLGRRCFVLACFQCAYCLKCCYLFFFFLLLKYYHDLYFRHYYPYPHYHYHNKLPFPPPPPPPPPHHHHHHHHRHHHHHQGGKRRSSVCRARNSW